MFFILLLAATGLLVTSATLDKRMSAAAVMLVMLAPCWIYTDIGAIRIDMRMGIALVYLACVALHPQTSNRLRFVAADFLLVALTSAQIISEFLTSPTAVSVTPDIILQWGVPYLFGRIAWRSMEDQSRNFTAIVTACVVLSVWAAIESVTRINPVDKMLGFGGSIQAVNDLHWGLCRAEENLTHPIFFGFQLAMLLTSSKRMNLRAASMRIWKHETNRQCGGAGSPPSSCRGSSSGTEESHGSGAARRGRRVEREALEASLEGGRSRRAPVEADPRSPREADGGTPAAVGEDRTGRSIESGLHD